MENGGNDQPNLELESTTQKRSSAFPNFVSLSALLALLTLGAWAYWKFIYYPTTPQYALDKFFAAARDKDFDKVYDLVQVPPTVKVLVRNGQELKAMARRMPGLVPELANYSIGNVEVKGDSASLDATTTMIGRDQKPSSSSLKVKMVKTNDIWRVDGNWILSEMKKKGLGGAFLNGI